MSIPAITAPPPHPASAINEAIKSAHHGLMQERSEYFESIRQRLKGDQRMRDLVKSHLREIGCSATWNAIVVPEVWRKGTL